MSRSTLLAGAAAALFVAGLAGGAALFGSALPADPAVGTAAAAGATTGEPDDAVPVYDADGALLRPERWEEWVLVGTSMGLSYSEGEPVAARGPDEPPGMFHNVLMPGWAYRAYRESGEFPERTMLALAIYDVGKSAPPRERGFYQGELVALELHVKDTGRFETGWGFFGFDTGVEKAEVVPAGASCYGCHAEHAAQDDVFTQFYPVLRGQDSDPPAPADGEEVGFRSGDLELTGLWFTPRGEGPYPAAVILRGSGDSRRDSPWARLFVGLLLEEGVAVLLPDKRGSGGSEGDWRTATFDDLADDALAAVRHLRSSPAVDPDRVGLVGLSQGGRVAPVAAARSDEVAFVVDVVGSAVPFTEQVRHEMEHTFREAGLSGPSFDAAMRLHRLAERYLRGEVSWETYRTALDRALESEWSEVARGFPPTRDHWRWAFFRGVVDFDPIPHWRRVRAPSLVLYGEDDANTPTARSVERLERAFDGTGPDRHEIRVFEGLDHGLLAPMEGDDHGMALHPEVVRTLRGWLEGVL